MSEIKYVVNGKYVDPNGKELGDAPSKADRAKKPGKAADAGTPPAEDNRTVDQLKAALEAAKVTIPADAKKDDLLKLAADNKA